MNLRRLDLEVEPQLARAVLDVQHTAYAIEAELIGDNRIPALHETLDDLVAARLSWLGAFLHGSLAGAVAWTQLGIGSDIDRLVVDPRYHRRGIGRALVLETLRQSPGRTTVSTGRDNAPARALYERLGFVHLYDHEVIAGLWISHYASEE